MVGTGVGGDTEATKGAGLTGHQPTVITRGGSHVPSSSDLSKQASSLDFDMKFLCFYILAQTN